ncbi:hypothetical protein NZD88_09095 [Chryseobacterium antibioticum]|uniref:Tox-PL-2 domain-containing protein n=1 Tax=Chryseobacterium pyrolae TaxID=2987481 RepID=A0ABT2IGE7_9FLAO|nr:papain fold toxin domain-containing protein [Chryseobacterium pyrolae]MCT2407691.1 hypothetical protein [Chryseobacterium pyrolae]
MPSPLKQLFQCKEFAAELMSRMASQGIKGEMVILKSDTGYIWSETLDKSITTNGDHVGVKVGNMVYDNMFPKEVEYSKWLYDLGIGFPKMQPPVVTPF